MIIRLTTQNFGIRKVTRERIIERLKSVLDRMPLSLTDARVSFRDVNGPRGGVDKECLIRIRLPKRGHFIARARGDSLGKAFSAATEKLQNALSKRLASGKRKRRSKIERDIALAELAA